MDATTGSIVGIDVSKDRLDVFVRPDGTCFTVEQTRAGHGRLVAELRRRNCSAIGIEATGGYEGAVVTTLAAAGLPVIVVNPAKIRALAGALGKRAKTDPIDAAVIAHFVEATAPEIRPLPDAETRLLADLTARRRQLVGMITAERQRRELSARQVQRSIDRTIRGLARELERIEAMIDEAVEACPAWQESQALLTSVPGVGPVIARTLVAELPELGQLDWRLIAALAGLAPWTRQSGRWRGQSFVGGGRSSVRAALYMAAMVAARHNAPMTAFRDRLIDAGKPKRLALVAVARKLLTILNAILRDRVPWRPESA